MKICMSPGLERLSAKLRGGTLMEFFVKQLWSREGPSGKSLKLWGTVSGMNTHMAFIIWRLNSGTSLNDNPCRERGNHHENDYSYPVNTLPSGCLAYLAV
jgi:hypothetical protein